MYKKKAAREINNERLCIYITRAHVLSDCSECSRHTAQNHLRHESICFQYLRCQIPRLPL